MANTNKMSEGVVQLYANQLEVTSDMSDAQLQVTRDVIDAKTLGENNKVPKTQHMPTVSYSGYNDYADDNLDEVHFAAISNTSQDAFTIIYGTAAGDRCYSVVGYIDSHSVPASVDGIIGISGSVSGEAFVRGKALNIDTTVSATGAQTGVQFNATGSDVITSGQTMGAIIHVTAVDTLTTATVVVEKSTDSTDGSDGTWGAVSGLSFTFTGTGHEVDTASATLADGDWLRVNTTTLTGTSATITVIAGRYVE